MSTLFLGGDIITMTDRTAEAVVAEDGRIVAVGKADELRARYPDAEVRDLGGRTLMPGFVDAHGHFAAYAMSLLQLSLRDARDMRTLLDSISGRRASTPEGGWVDARDYDPSKLSERRDPTLEELDSACPDRPLCLHHVSGHLGLFNSVAMRTLGVDSYRLEEGPFISAIQGIPMGSPEDIWHAFMEAQGRFASYGITTAQEALIKREMVPLVRPLIDSPEFWIDILGFADAAHRAEVMDMLGIPAGEWRGHLKVKGVKILLDGSPQGGTAWMAEPYLDGHNGSATTDPTDLRRYLREAAELGLEVAVHCNGDAACRELVDAAEEVGRDTGLEQHVVMIHAQFLTPDLMDRMKGIGMEPSFFVSHSWYWGDLYVELFGRDRADRLSPCGTALSKDMRITIHQDEPVLEPWPMDAVFCAVNRRTEGGDVRGEGERIGIMEALRAVTVDSAGQNREEGIGTIEEGGWADLVVLDRNPLGCDPSDLREVTVLETIKRGRTVYRRNRSLIGRRGSVELHQPLHRVQQGLGTMEEPEDAHADNLQLSKKWKMSADAGIRTRVLTLARLSDNQLHYVHTGRLWIPSSDIKVATDRMRSPIPSPSSIPFICLYKSTGYGQVKKVV